MAGTWTIEIDEGADQLIIDANAKFQLGFKGTPNDNNKIESIVYQLVVEGDVVGIPSAVAAGYQALGNLVIAKGAPVRINIKQDGVSWWDLKPENGFVGPFITSLTPIDSPGNGQSHWKYRLEAIFRSQNVGGGEENQVYEFVSTLSVQKDHDIVIRKVWTAMAKSTSSTAARSFCRRFKPSGNDLKTEEKEEFSAASCAIAWVWQALQAVECEVSYEGGGDSYIEDRQAGVRKPPILYREQQGARTIRVRVNVRGFTAALTPVAKHFAESATLREITGARRAKPRIEKAEDGIYILSYEELWLCTEPSDPTPTHDQGHNLIKLDASNVPADGAIRS